MKLKTLIQKAIELEEEHGDDEVCVQTLDGARMAIGDLGVVVGQDTTVLVETAAF